jgi:formate-dependent nitrite reductase membrane component NrfD
MSMGVWALTAFGNFAAGSVGADLLGRRRTTQALTAAQAASGVYLGSYTGVLLATTAVPVWARSREFLGPIFVATGTATGAAAVRLVLAATGLPAGHPTREALGRIEAGAMTAELVLSWVNEKRLGRLAEALEEGSSGRLFQAAKGLAAAGIVTRLAQKRLPAWVQHAASVGYLTAGLMFRYAWVGAGKRSARDDEAVARMARAYGTRAEPDADIQVVPAG